MPLETPHFGDYKKILGGVSFLLLGAGIATYIAIRHGIDKSIAQSVKEQLGLLQYAATPELFALKIQGYIDTLHEHGQVISHGAVRLIKTIWHK